MQYQNVLSPIRVGKHVFRNRLIVSPTRISALHSAAKIPTEEAMTFWGNRAKTGVGLVTVTGVAVDPDWEDRWDVRIRQARDRLTTMVERIHFYGAKASMQLTGVFDGELAVCDGALGMFGAPGRQISVDEMMRYRDKYVEAVTMLKKLGFDGVFLHFGHATPLAQFLSPYTNKRTDQYGGSFENRTRYVLDILTAVRETLGDDMFIEARISGTEYQPGAIDIEEGIRIAEALSPHLDILQVSAGMHRPDWMAYTHASGFRPRLPNIHAAEAIKKSGRVNCFVAGIGAIRDLEDAEQIVTTGKADFTVFARALIADPDMIKKCMDGRIEDVTPCIQCMRCHDNGAYGGHNQCSVNPKFGLEFWIERMEEPASVVKKVAVIGGGPAGMKAALTASGRGHDVTLYEMSDSLGGLMKYAAHVSFKYPHARYMQYLIDQIAKTPIDVKLNTRATPEIIKAGGFDAVISAVGSEPVVPPIPGVEHCVLAVNAHAEEDKLGGNVTIIGGGQVGVELALHLVMNRSKNVTVLEQLREIAPDASPTQRGELIARVRDSSIKIINYATCTAVEPGKVIYDHDGVAKSLETDSIILAVGMKSKTAESDSFMGAAASFAAAGDCNKPRIIEWATKEGYYAAVTL